jgi:hypothetical protein
LLCEKTGKRPGQTTVKPPPQKNPDKPSRPVKFSD